MCIYVCDFLELKVISIDRMTYLQTTESSVTLISALQTCIFYDAPVTWWLPRPRKVRAPGQPPRHPPWGSTSHPDLPRVGCPRCMRRRRGR